MPYWDERARTMALQYPDVDADYYHIDNLSAQFVLDPGRFDIVVASNLFGDILSDLGPACTGTIGIAPSANLNPERTFPSMFEPVHGSADGLLVVPAFEQGGNPVVTRLQFFELVGNDGHLKWKRVLPMEFALIEKEAFEAMAKNISFRVVQLYGNYAQSSFQPAQSPVMIWTLEKP